MTMQKVFRKPIIHMIPSQQRIFTVQRKVSQEVQIVEKIKYIVVPGSEFVDGIRPVDLALKLDVPQATVRKFLRNLNKKGLLMRCIVSARHSYYRPTSEFRNYHQS